MAGRTKKQKSITADFPTRLTERMEYCDVKNNALAEAIGKQSSQAISGYRQGNREPDIETLKKIADELNTSIDYLVGRVNDPDPNPDVVQMCKYTGLSSEAIEALHQFQEDSDIDAAQKYRKHVRRVIHLLSWIIVHDRDINNLSELTARSLLDEIYSYFLIDKTRSLEIHDLQKFVNNESSLIGKFDEDQLMIGQLPFYDPFTVEDYEILKLMSIQRRIEHLKTEYWKEIYKEQERIENAIKDEHLKDTVEVNLADIHK